MLDLSNFLNKYRRLIKDDSDLKEVILEIFKTKSIPLSSKDLVLRGDNLIVSCNPVFKNEIFIKKTELLELVNSKQDRYKFKDIRF